MDKSCKLAVTTMEKYLEMGIVHTSNDKEISRQEFVESKKVVNGHTDTRPCTSRWRGWERTGAMPRE